MTDYNLGPRPLVVSSGNRGDVRRWCRANGVPSSVVEKMTTRELADAYNLDSTLAVLQNAESVPRAAKPAQPAIDVADVVTKAVTAALSAIPQNSGLDEERVIELIKEHAGYSSVSVIEVRDSEGVRERLEGLHHVQTPEVLAVLNARVNVWLAGPAGSGKTTMAKHCAQALGLAFYSTGAVQNEYKLTGFVDAEGRTVRTAFREAYEHGGLFLWDEVDASAANALVAFNQALANDSFPFPDGMVERHPDFLAIAAANTYGNGATAEYVGRNRIDAATLDRFAMIEIRYDEALECAIAAAFDPEDGYLWAKMVQRYRAAAHKLGLRHMITPRASEYGAKMRRSGVNGQTIINTTLRRGLDQASWDKLEAQA